MTNEIAPIPPKSEIQLAEEATKQFSAKQALASLPAHLAAAGAASMSGMEWVLPSDLVFPRIKVTQSGDPFAKERAADGKSMKANPGDLWHKGKSEVYTPFGGYATVVPIKVQREYLLWHPRKSGKGLKEKSTDPKSPIARMCAEAAAKARAGEAIKNDEVEQANESHSWLLWDVDRQEAYILSFARGNIAESSSCLSDIATKRIPMQGYLFALEAFDKKAKAPNPNFNAARFRHIGWAPAALYERLSKIAESMAGKEMSGADPEDDFVPAATGASGTSHEELS